MFYGFSYSKMECFIVMHPWLVGIESDSTCEGNREIHITKCNKSRN